jgi:ParB family chromosome partitioning protein
MSLQTIKLTNCYESPTNPRGQKFEGAEFDGLVASIKEKGVLMPILVRPVKGKYEVVAGNRRLRAAKVAKLTELPARVEDMTDIEVREAQIVENLQRADVPPIDEAYAYAELIKSKTTKHTVETIAAKIGKSASYVRQRLALSSLGKQYADKVRSGELPVAHAQLIARFDSKGQIAAYKEATKWGNLQPLDTFKLYVQAETVKAAMKSPPWKDNEAAQAEIARVTGQTGGGKTLFGEKAAASYDDPVEYATALAAYLKITIDQHKADKKPLTLISDRYSTSKGVLGSSGYELASSVKGCKSAHDGLIVEGDDVGRILHICTDKECPAHHPKAKRSARSNAEKAESAAEKKKREQEQKREEAAKKRADAAFVAALDKVKDPLSDGQLDVLFNIVTTEWGYETEKVASAFGIQPIVEKKKNYTNEDYERPVKEHFTKLGKSGKLRLILALAIEQTYGEKAKYLKLL